MDTELVSQIKDSLSAFANDSLLSHPPDATFGHISSNIAMIQAKKLKKNPMDIATNIKKKLDKDINLKDVIEKIKIAKPGFINFYLKKDFLIKQAESLNYQTSFKKKLRRHAHGKTMVIDYSAPNIAKPFGIGHLRSTNIGQAIYNLYRSLGWNCIGDNHLGDWGTQFGKLIVAINLWSKEPLKSLSISDLEKLYIKFHQFAKDDPNLIKKARLVFKKLEEGDPDITKMWQICVDISLVEFNKVYDLLGVHIDYTHGESFYLSKLQSIIDIFVKKGLAKKSQGALIVDLEPLPPAMLQKSNGATTYFTRDLATVKYRLDTWKPDQIIYEVGADQTLHFQQLFSACQKIGWMPKDGFVHVAHGLIRWKGGKFSTRKGDTIHLSDVVDKAINQAKKIVATSLVSKDLTDTERGDMISSVAIGAIKFSDLVQHPKRDIIFDWDKIMGLSGDSGPYLQYTYARCLSVLTKTTIREQKNISISSIVGRQNQQEINLLNLFYQFEEKIIESVRAVNPSIICQYLLKVAQAYNEFYGQHKIIDDPQEIFRIFLTKTTASVVKMGLDLLGIKTIDKM